MKHITAALVVTATIGAWPHQKFRVGVDAVRVDVLVTDGNRPIAGLAAADFEVRDNGVLQRIDAITIEDVPLSLMLVLDTSVSVRGEPLTHLKQAALAVLQTLTPSDRSSLLTFSSELTRTAWTNDHTRIQHAIVGAEAGGATSLHDAAYAALTARDTQSARALALVFSDGDDTASWLPGQLVIDAAGRTDAVVYAVGLPSKEPSLPGYRVDFSSGLPDARTDLQGPLVRASFLEALTRETGGKYFTAERHERLRQTFIQIVNEFRSRYLLTYTPHRVESSGWHRLDVRIKGRNATVTARRGYLR
jgi:VWFA-related protein